MNTPPPKHKRVLYQVFRIFVSTSAGIIATTILVTPFIGILNAMANDGPIFPPPLIAFGFYGMPLAILLLPIQIIAAVYEASGRKPLGLALVNAAILDGLLAGCVWYYLLKSSEMENFIAVSILASALIQSSVVFGCYWLVHRAGTRFFLKNPLVPDNP